MEKLALKSQTEMVMAKVSSNTCTYSKGLFSKGNFLLLSGKLLSASMGAFFAFTILNLLIKPRLEDNIEFYDINGPEQYLETSSLDPLSTLSFAIETCQSLKEELSILFFSAKEEFDVLVLNKKLKESTVIGDIPIEGGIGGLDHIISLAEYYRESIYENKIPVKKDFLISSNQKEIIQSNFTHTPIGAPTLGEVTSEFGKRISPFTHGRSFHTGIDISISEGSPVKASAEGYVVYSGRKGGYGKIVHLKHEGGRETLYAHLSKVNVLPGHKVSRGQVIGKVGSTGQSTGPHLHYEVRQHGRPINPRPFIEMAKILKQKSQN